MDSWTFDSNEILSKTVDLSSTICVSRNAQYKVYAIKIENQRYCALQVCLFSINNYCSHKSHFGMVWGRGVGWGGMGDRAGEDGAGTGMGCPIPAPPPINRHTPVKALPSLSSRKRSVKM